MNIFDEIAQQNIYRHLDHQILQSIQNQHQAAHDLMWELSKPRQNISLKASIIKGKISQVQNYLVLQDELLKALQQKSGKHDLLNWIYEAATENHLLAQLVKGQKEALQNQIYSTIKRVFLFKEEEALFNQYLNDVKFSNKYIQELKQILLLVQDGNTLPERATLINADNMEQQFFAIFQRFQKKTECFNFQMLKLLERMYKFQQKIRTKFKEVIECPEEQQKTKTSIQVKNNEQPRVEQFQPQKIQNYQYTFKNEQIKLPLPISDSQITFYNKGSLSISSPRERKTNINVSTPRKNLYTEDDVEQYAVNAILRSKMTRQMFDRRSNQTLNSSRRVLQVYNDAYNETMDRFYRNTTDSSGYERRSLGPKSISNMNTVSSIPGNYQRKTTVFKNPPLKVLERRAYF